MARLADGITSCDTDAMTRPSPDTLPRLSRRDLMTAAWLGTAGLVDRVVGSSRHRAVSMQFAAILGWLKPRQRRTRADAIAAARARADLAPAQRAEDADSMAAARLEEALLMKRLSRQPDWRPRFAVDGGDQVDAALAGGGVALWVVNQRMGMLYAVMAAHNAGWPVHRLSNWVHGPSSLPHMSRFGDQKLNGRWQAVENRFAQRIVIGPDGAATALTALADAVQDGGLVVSNATMDARRTSDATVMGCRIRLATGAVAAAHASGADILACALVRDGSGLTVQITPIAGRTEPVDRDALAERMAPIAVRANLETPGLWLMQSGQITPDQ